VAAQTTRVYRDLETFRPAKVIAPSWLEIYRQFARAGFAPEVVYDIGAAHASWSSQVIELFPLATYHFIDALFDVFPPWPEIQGRRDALLGATRRRTNEPPLARSPVQQMPFPTAKGKLTFVRVGERPKRTGVILGGSNRNGSVVLGTLTTRTFPVLEAFELARATASGRSHQKLVGADVAATTRSLGVTVKVNIVGRAEF
jgi:hypothetical protein